MTNEAPKVNRFERRKLAFRDKITEAAMRLFGERGVADTPVAAIIEEADIAHKTFFNHFPTKDHLLMHIADSFTGEAYDRFIAGFEKQTDPAKRLEYFFVTMVAKALEAVSPNYKQLLNVYLISGTASGELRSRQKDRFSAVIGRVLTEAKQNKRLKPGVNLDTATEVTVGVCVAILLNWSLEDDYPLVARMRKAVRFLNEGLFTDDA